MKIIKEVCLLAANSYKHLINFRGRISRMRRRQIPDDLIYLTNDLAALQNEKKNTVQLYPIFMGREKEKKASDKLSKV